MLKVTGGRISRWRKQAGVNVSAVGFREGEGILVFCKESIYCVLSVYYPLKKNTVVTLFFFFLLLLKQEI